MHRLLRVRGRFAGAGAQPRARLAGHPRRADRPLNRRHFERKPARRSRTPSSTRAPCADVPRPRPVQGRQRHLRPRRGRRAAAPARRSCCSRSCAPRHARAPGRRRVRGCCSHCPLERGARRSPSCCEAVAGFRFVWESRVFERRREHRARRRSPRARAASRELMTRGRRRVLRREGAWAATASRLSAGATASSRAAPRRDAAGCARSAARSTRTGSCLYAQPIVPLRDARDRAQHYEVLLRLLDEDGAPSRRARSSRPRSATT